MGLFFMQYPAAGGGSGGGVTTLNGLSGALTLVAGSNITITPSGSNITIASTGGGGANTALSNLAAVAINADLLPDSDNSRNLGSPSFEWDSLYLVNNIVFDGAAMSIAEGNISMANATGATAAADFTLQGGNSVNGAASNIFIQSGSASGTAGGGIFSAAGGDAGAGSSLAGGESRLVGGNTAGSGAGGAASLYAGNADTGVGGNVVLNGGASNSAQGGNVIVTPGAGASPGTFNINDSSLSGSSAGWVWSLTSTVTGAGAWVANSGGGANTALSNLAAVAFNADLVPAGNVVQNIGAPGTNINTIYVQNLNNDAQIFAHQDLSGDTGTLWQVGTKSEFSNNTSSQDLYVRSGAAHGGNSNSGLAQFGSQAADDGNSGPVFLLSGQINGTTFNTGDLSIGTGTFGSTSSGSSGSINIDTGAAPGGTRGSVSITGNNITIIPDGLMNLGGVITAGPIQLANLASDPSPLTGMIYFNTGSNKIKVFNGTTWETVTSV